MVPISIIEDHKAYRQALIQLLEMSDKYQCISAYENAKVALENLNGQEELILLDINLPGMSGIEAIPELKKINPQTKIIMLTMLDDDQSILEAILNGANGYLLKKTKPAKILEAIDICLQGGSPMTPGIATKVLNLFQQHIPKKNKDYTLTPREIEILNLLVEGVETQQIADKLFISIQTVRNHIRHIYEKLQVHSKSQAVVKAIKERLV